MDLSTYLRTEHRGHSPIGSAEASERRAWHSVQEAGWMVDDPHAPMRPSFSGGSVVAGLVAAAVVLVVAVLQPGQQPDQSAAMPAGTAHPTLVATRA